MKHRFISKKYWKEIGTPFGSTNEKAARYDDCINLSIGDPGSHHRQDNNRRSI